VAAVVRVVWDRHTSDTGHLVVPELKSQKIHPSNKNMKIGISWRRNPDDGSVAMFRVAILVVLVAAAYVDGLQFSLFQPRPPKKISSPPSNVKVLILPGFGNDASDYILSQATQGSLVQSLKNRGWENVEILPMKRSDWLNVFLRGAFDWQFWAGTAPPTGPAFAWYLRRVADAIVGPKAENDDDDDVNVNVDDDGRPKVLLVCHSAGGWLARAALGYLREQIDPARTVCGIVTLGAPHLPPPPSVMDMTRGALQSTHTTFPGAYHQDEDGVFYVTVVGDAIAGVAQQKTSPFEPTSITGFAFASYQAVSGVGTASGDGVVPVSHAHLEGATQLNLPGIFHSINVSIR
jgi:hypothetical protein